MQIRVKLPANQSWKSQRSHSGRPRSRLFGAASGGGAQRWRQKMSLKEPRWRPENTSRCVSLASYEGGMLTDDPQTGSCCQSCNDRQQTEEPLTQANTS